MKPTIAWTLVISGTLLGACQVDDPLEPGPEPDIEARALEIDLGVEDEVCPTTRHVMWRFAEGPCPSFGSWVGTRLFQAGTTWLADNDIEIDGDLAKVCLYEWNNDDVAEPPQGAIDNLYNRRVNNIPIFESGERDCEIVLPQTAGVDNDAITDAMGEVLEGLFKESIGHMDGEALDLANNEDERDPVDVMVVDTESPLIAPPRSKHGEVMARIIESIACPDGPDDCAVRVHRVLGLRRWNGGIDDVRGGYFASYTDIAAAIKEATDRWLVMNEAAEVPSRLVINFSAGWHPYAAFKQGGPGERAVLLAIRNAVCHGAIFIAAAGNNDTFCADVPLLPAGWEPLGAPDDAACMQVGGLASEADPTAPLVYAVGGLDLHGDELLVGREGGRSRLAAAGAHTLVGAPDEPTPALTGTSISSAVASGIAALLWSFDGEPSGDEIVDAIYDGGQGLGIDQYADFGMTIEPIKRIEACGALEKLCVGNPNCPTSPIDWSGCGARWPAADGVVAAIDALPAAAATAVAFDPATKNCNKLCGGTIVLHTRQGSVADCGPTEPDSRDRLISPQPPTPLCQACSLKVESTSPTAQTSASLNDDFAGAVIEDLVITVVYKDGSEHAYDFDDAVQLDSSSVTDIAIPGLEEGKQIVDARVEITLDSGYSEKDALVIEQDPTVPLFK